ncbi:MAG: serine acetyltransferase [Myxococcales bacterium]|jgi:serine O-acetyltransferase|nr:serine acetyltransferase [Myxococcales bacterium]
MTTTSSLPPCSEEGLAHIVERLTSDAPLLDAFHLRPGLRRELPSRDSLIEIVETLRAILFPGFFGPSEISAESLGYAIGAALDRVSRALNEQIRRGLCAACAEPTEASCVECAQLARDLTRRFLQRLPFLRDVLLTDVRAAYEGDPSATSEAEVLFCYPGIFAITNYRLAHELHSLGVPYLPRIITELAHSLTGIDIHPGATIGGAFFIDHGSGVVIGETCVIGEHVSIYQGVTLGAKSFPLDAQGNPIKGVPRHPILEDGVVIYSNATLLGRITVGSGSTIGGNVWLTHSVPPGSTITQANARAPSP